MVTEEIELDESDQEFFGSGCLVLDDNSKSESMRAATQEKIRADRRKLRELRRQQAMAAYGNDFEEVFESIEAEDLEDR